MPKPFRSREQRIAHESLAIRCPQCGALPGEKCIVPQGGLMQFHTMRVMYRNDRKDSDD